MALRDLLQAKLCVVCTIGTRDREWVYVALRTVIPLAAGVFLQVGHGGDIAGTFKASRTHAVRKHEGLASGVLIAVVSRLASQAR